MKKKRNGAYPRFRKSFLFPRSIIYYLQCRKYLDGKQFAFCIISSGSVVKDVGKNLNNTKKLAKWGLMIDDKRCVVTLKHSILTHKKMIWFNDQVVKEVQGFLSGDFDYAWSSEKHLFKIVIKKEKKNYIYCTYMLFPVNR